MCMRACVPTFLCHVSAISEGLLLVVLSAHTQVINGIMEREDWKEAIKTPIGMLPTGSGNALCASALYESK